MECIDATPGSLHEVARGDVFDGVMQLYNDRATSVILEYPMFVKFLGEAAVDEGGVQRDMFTAFWDRCYSLLFDGCSTLVPMLHPQMDLMEFVTVGRVMSHGYLATGILPDRIVLPVLIVALLGPGTVIPDYIFIETFMDFLSITERLTLRKAMDSTDNNFQPELLNQLVCILSRFGCRQLPTPLCLLKMIVQAAKYEFVIKPAAVLSLLHSGVPSIHQPFWKNKSVQDMYTLHCSLVATPEKVIAFLESDPCSQAQECVYNHLVAMLGSMQSTELRLFLRFVTGCSVCVTPKITVTYNSLSGPARCPIAHTCDSTLQLSVFYRNYDDFNDDFKVFLSSSSTNEDFCWRMDGR